MKVSKALAESTIFTPLEKLTIVIDTPDSARLLLVDGAGQAYSNTPVHKGQSVALRIRGAVGTHRAMVFSQEGQVIDSADLRVQARTALTCSKGPYANLFNRLELLIVKDPEKPSWVINGRRYNLLIGWSRDHVYTLKAAKYFINDVTSGLDYFLDTQAPSGMFFDCIYRNTEAPAPCWNAEALGKGNYFYDDNMKYHVRRVPVLADTEYVFTEGVWYAWKATGDDAWMEKQLPRLEKALVYMTTDPVRWSKKHGLVKRSFTADEWDFANPHYCEGDHRCIHPQDPSFLFHGNNSGMYAMYWRMAQMYEHLGNADRAAELRRDGEALRQRANDKLWFKTNYGHQIPESGNPEKFYALSGDERERMSLSTGYTINRGLPTHAMAVKILNEYQRRYKKNLGESFAEWWTMDPPYKPSEWPAQHTNTAGCPEGEYMNGGICTIIAGEIAKAAFDHGCEQYGVDILQRVWQLSERDNGALHQVYRRLPENATMPKTTFTAIDLRDSVNRGLRHNAVKGVEAWTGEGTNDMRNLPTGKQRFGEIEFDVIDPATNGGRSVLRLDPKGQQGAESVTIAVGNCACKSLYFLHTVAFAAPDGATVGCYEIHYADGTTVPVWLRNGTEIGPWWGISELAVNKSVARRAWWGKNPNWKTVGMFMFGWNNPYPDKLISAITAKSLDVMSGGGILLGAISASDMPVAFELAIRSYGLPDCWAQAAVYYAIAEGLVGIEDTGTAFSTVAVAPRWAATGSDTAAATLHYPASDGYCSYEYTLDRKKRCLSLEITGSFKTAAVHCLLPAGPAKRVTVEGSDVGTFKNLTIESSRYVDFMLDRVPAGAVTIYY